MRTFIKNRLNTEQANGLLKRPANYNAAILSTVREILNEIKDKGVSAALKYAKEFDDANLVSLRIDKGNMELAGNKLPVSLKMAIEQAYRNIRKFHEMQYPESYSVVVDEGIECSRKYLPIESAGLYVPGGTAPLISTLLMLGIPANIAGVKRIVLCTPSRNDEIHPAILHVAKLCNIDEIYKIGGAQAIGLMAFGGGDIQPVDKIFGPGNQYVTLAKMLISSEYGSASIDMPAGPSEVLIIADKEAEAEFIASDILSQAEHGFDSQSILVTDSPKLAEEVNKQIDLQLPELERKEYIRKSLNNSFILITENIDEALEFSNRYAPEHLILNLKNAEALAEKVQNAGSVFIGAYSPESAGDYASGTNHILPTSGFAKSFSGLSVVDFMKAVTFQKLDKTGLKSLSDTIIELAETEGLDAHANAVKMRFKDEN